MMAKNLRPTDEMLAASLMAGRKDKKDSPQPPQIETAAKSQSVKTTLPGLGFFKLLTQPGQPKNQGTDVDTAVEVAWQDASEDTSSAGLPTLKSTRSGFKFEEDSPSPKTLYDVQSNLVEVDAAPPALEKKSSQHKTQWDVDDDSPGSIDMMQAREFNPSQAYAASVIAHSPLEVSPQVEPSVSPVSAPLSEAVKSKPQDDVPSKFAGAIPGAVAGASIASVALPGVALPVNRAAAKKPVFSLGQLNRSIAMQIATLTVLLLLVTLFATTFLSAARVRSSIATQYSQQIGLRAQEVSKQLESWLETGLTPLQTLTLNNELKTAIHQRNASYVGTDGLLQDESSILATVQALDVSWRAAADTDALITTTIDPGLNSTTQLLNGFKANLENHIEVFATDRYGATVASTGRLSDYYQADETWWQQAWNNGAGAVYISDIEFDDSAGVNALLIAVPVYSNDATQEVIGVLRTTYVLTALADISASQHFGQTGFLQILNSAGEEIFNGQRDTSTATPLPVATLTNFVSESQGVAKVRDQSGTQVFTGFSNVSLNAGVPNWTLIVRQNVNEALATANQIVTNGIIAMLVALIIATLVVTLLTRRLTKPISELADVAQRVGQGDLTQLATVNSQNEIGMLAQTFNESILKLRESSMLQINDVERNRQLQQNIGQFIEVASEMAQGDLTQRGRVTEDALGNVIDAINLMAEEFSVLLQDVQKASVSVGQGSGQMQTVTGTIAQKAQQQVLEAQKANHNVQRVIKSMRLMAGNVDSSAKAAEQTLKASALGQQSVSDTLAGMQSVREDVQGVAAQVRQLGQQSQGISAISDTISDIASQTSLLALGAALEAAGAGDAGRRFAVVADEVSRLAERSADSARQVTVLVQGIQREVQLVIKQVEQSSSKADQSYQIATQAGQRLEEIAHIARQSSDITKAITQVTQEQVEQVEQVGKVVQTITGLSEDSQVSVVQGREAADRLQVLADQLTKSLSRFRLS
jgi:methyl-accepting chemotaxis protein